MTLSVMAIASSRPPVDMEYWCDITSDFEAARVSSILYAVATGIGSLSGSLQPSIRAFNMAYVTIDLEPDAMVIRPVGKHRWASLRNALRIDRADVASVEPGGITAENGPVGLRCPGTNIPGHYLAGTFWRFWGPPERRVKSFWIRRHPGSCIRIGFRNASYDFAMVEVGDPAAETFRIQEWIDAGASPG